MHTLARTAVVALATTAIPVAAGQTGDFYRPDVIRQLRLEFHSPSWHQDLVAARAAGNTTWVRADLVFEGRRYPDVGVQHKGWSTYSGGMRRKEPFKIDTEVFVPGQEVWGIDKISLDNGALFGVLQEVFATRITGEVAHCPRSNLVHVLAGTPDDMLDLGLYTSTERVDRRFRRLRLRDSDSHRYTPSEFGFYPGFDYRGPNTSSYSSVFFVTGGDPATAFVDMRDAAMDLNDAANATVADEIADTISWDLTMRLMLALMATNNADSFRLGKNYYLQSDAFHGDRMFPVPWDLDLALLSFGVIDVSPWGAPIMKTMRQDSARERVLAIARHMIEHSFDWPRHRALAFQLRDEGNLIAQNSPYELAVNRNLGGKVARIRDSIRQSRVRALARPVFQREVPAIDRIALDPALPRAGDAPWLTCRVTLPGLAMDEVLVWSRIRGAYAPAPLRDDGASHDGAAGDGVWGGRLPVAETGDRVEFFVEARPADLTAASYGLAPITTELHPYAYDVGWSPDPSGLRLTELLYDGAEGGFVEVTNTGAAPVDLAGWSLDDASGVAGTLRLDAAGVLARGASFVVSEESPSAFRAAWGLAPGDVVLGPNSVARFGRDDVAHLFDPTGRLVDRLAYGDLAVPGSHRPRDASAVACDEALAVDDVLAWSAAAPNDGAGSWVSAGGDVGSPGAYAPRACDLVRVCSPNTPASTFRPVRLSVSGDRDAFFGELELRIEGAQPLSPAFPLVAPAHGFDSYPAGQGGLVCLGGVAGRLDQLGLVVDEDGEARATVRPYALPGPAGPRTALPGETWTFQWWLRDRYPVDHAVWSDAVRVTFR